MRTWLCAGGTVVATRDGAVAVARLLPGAVLAARQGGVLTVAAVLRIRLSIAALTDRPALWPVRIAAGALADEVPPTDTLVLPDQMLAVPGHPEIAARWLVDGVAVAREKPAVPLDVFALELGEDGVPEGAGLLHDGPPGARPDEAALHALRAHLAARAGVVVGVVRGSIDALEAARLEGWADDGSCRPVTLEVVVDGIAAPPFCADRPRADLAAAGIGDGRRGFMAALDPPLDPRRRHLVRVRRALDGADLPGSPLLIDSQVGDGTAGLASLLDALPPDPALVGAVAAVARAVAARLESQLANRA